MSSTTACVACRQKVAHDVTVCPHCGKNFPVTQEQIDYLNAENESRNRIAMVTGGLLAGCVGVWAIFSSFGGPEFQIQMFVFGIILVLAGFAVILRGVTA